jgi:cobalt/nickel transport system ATP-binding protein
MELLDELHHQGKTILITTHDIELAYPWADRAILLYKGGILQEDIPEVAFGTPEYVRMAHLSVPVLLDLYRELQNRGFTLPEKKPRSILDMIHIIEKVLQTGRGHIPPGSITVCNVEETDELALFDWMARNSRAAVGAMGTRAKQRALDQQISLEYSYGVIDKCILHALRGEDALILTTESMFQRVYDRVASYNQENSIQIRIRALGEQPSE